MPNSTNTTQPAAVFCLTPGWDMRNVFQWGNAPENHCIMYFGVDIDTAGKYAGAIIFSFLLTFFLEGWGYFRKWFTKTYLCDTKTQKEFDVPELLHYLPSVFYAWQMTCAWFAMLGAMLMEIGTFIALVCGFFVGHALFSVYLPRRAKKLLAAASGRSPSSPLGFDSDAVNKEAQPLLASPMGEQPDAVCHCDEEEIHVASPCCGGVSK